MIASQLTSFGRCDSTEQQGQGSKAVAQATADAGQGFTGIFQQHSSDQMHEHVSCAEKTNDTGDRTVEIAGAPLFFPPASPLTSTELSQSGLLLAHGYTSVAELAAPALAAESLLLEGRAGVGEEGYPLPLTEEASTEVHSEGEEGATLTMPLLTNSPNAKTHEPVLFPLSHLAQQAGDLATQPVGLGADTQLSVITARGEAATLFSPETGLSPHFAPHALTLPEGKTQVRSAVLEALREQTLGRSEGVAVTSPDAASLGEVAPPLATWWQGAAAPNDVAAEWSPVTLNQKAPTEWGASLREVLGERLAVHSTHGIDRALVRLDPPMLGALEIIIQRQAGGALAVQLVASHGEVVRQLYAISDVLRQDLQAKQFAPVAVDIREGYPGGGSEQRHAERDSQQPQPRAPGRALQNVGNEQDDRFVLRVS